MQKVAKKWNELTPAGFRFKVDGYTKERYGRTRYRVVVDGPLYETHKRMVLSGMEEKTQGGNHWQISVYAVNHRIACYVDEISDRFRGWAGRNLVKKILEREKHWENEWKDMQLMIVKVMRWRCYELPAENVRDVVRECRAPWRSMPCAEVVRCSRNMAYCAPI